MIRASHRIRATGCAFTALIALVACGTSGGPGRPGGTGAHQLIGTARHIQGDSAAAQRLAQAEQAFSLALLRQVGDGEHVVGLNLQGVRHIVSPSATTPAAPIHRRHPQTLGEALAHEPPRRRVAHAAMDQQ